MKQICIIALFLIVILFALNATIHTDKEEITVETYSDTTENKLVDYVYPTKTLKQNFLSGIAICDKQNIAQNGLFESCVLEQVKMKSDEDFNTLLKINTYCDSTTSNEADRRSCVDNVLDVE